jgi:hypothetical protein
VLCLDAINSDPKALVVSAFLAILVGAAGWVGKLAVEGFLWSYRRRSREIEIMAALLAEIGSNVDAYKVFARPETARRLAEQVRSIPNYKIYIPLYKDLFVFDQVRSEITVLPEGVIDAIVGFYSEGGALDALSLSVQESRFEAFPADRRAHYVEYLRQQAAIVVGKAESAMTELRRQSLRTQNGRARLTVASSVSAIAVVFAGSIALNWAWTACSSGGQTGGMIGGIVTAYRMTMNL